MVRFGVPGQNVDSLSYADSRLSTVPVVHAPRRPTVTDKKFPMWCEWRTNKEVQAPVLEGEFWKLIRFESNGDATWLMINSASGGALDDIRDQVNVDVTPSASANIDIDGAVVNAGANPSGIPLETVADAATNTLDVQIQVASARTGAPADKNDTGVCSFDDTTFVVDGEGYVTLVGGAGPAVDSIDIDFSSGAGTDPVVPSGAGVISFFGNTVVNATNLNSPVATHSRAANQLHVDVQLGTALAASPADPFDAGLISADNIFFTVDANGFMSMTDILLQQPVGTTFNLGINYSSPTFTVSGSDGTALSATNPGYVVLPSKASAGYKIVHAITSNLTFDDDSGTSDLTGNTWGTTTTVAWASAMPFFLYAVADDAGANVTIMISRIPHMFSSPAAAFIATSASAVATTQGSFFSLDGGITVADYDSNPTASLGSFRMAKNDAANDDWTVEALANQDGFGRWNDSVYFTMDFLHFGATSNIFYSTTGGDTIPAFPQTGGVYIIHRDGWCDYEWNCDAIAVTGGVGTGELRATIPYVLGLVSTTITHPGNVQWLSNSGGTFTTGITYSDVSNAQYVELMISGVGTALVTPGDWTTDLRLGSISVSFFADRA